jgi:hypothetical protein
VFFPVHIFRHVEAVRDGSHNCQGRRAELRGFSLVRRVRASRRTRTRRPENQRGPAGRNEASDTKARLDAIGAEPIDSPPE